MSPEQRGLLRETQLVMSLMEGFSDWVMDEVGEQVLPDVAGIRRRFEARRNQRRRGIDRIIARLTGLDLKLEQYRRGERFVAGVYAAGGERRHRAPVGRPGHAAHGRRDGRASPVGGAGRAPSVAARIAADGAAGLMPGSGPGGVPAAIALTPILSARYREADLERIRAAAPGARLVTVSLEGLADGPLDDVEVMLRGPLPAATFERILVRAPRLDWVHSATAGVERVLVPAAAGRGLVITNARGVFSEPIAEYVLMMILAIIRRLPQLLELQRERTWQPLPATEMRDITVGIVGLGSIGRAVASRALCFGSRVRRHPPDRASGRGRARSSRASTASCGPTSCRSCSPRATWWSWRCR